MALWIQIISGSDEPIYSQIVEQIRQAIAKGELGIGEKLPAVRKLASELIINPNTVAKAYTILEQSGFVATKTGSGTFVTDPKLRHHDAVDINALSERFDSVIARGLSLGINAEELISLFNNRVNKFLKK
ncbi:MAG: GntR family transcriptional regulator [Phycisphaerales bacterium]